MAQDNKDNKGPAPLQEVQKGHPGRMAQDGHPGRQSLNEGHKGHTGSHPTYIQGGHASATSQAAPTPPTGGPSERAAPSKAAEKKD